MFKQYINRCSTLMVAAAVVVLSIPAHAVDLNLSQTPLSISPSVPPLNMLTVGRDHKLYYEAYNDYSDLNEDDQLDIRYKPAEIDYYGYFDSFKCYTHDGAKFNPTRRTATKTCTSEWSGDFLNYLTTARIDALRKVLYGGYRGTDSATATVLERTYIPQDAHSWGKEYTSVAVDGYDLTQYAPLSLPTTNNRHLFANTTPLNTGAPLTTLNQPLLRILTNRSERIWNWVSIERPVAGTQVLNSTGGRTSVTPTDLIVKVAVCVANLLEDNCKAYGASTKPIGLLQEFGESEAMFFGLITGSYSKNISGGVLRQRMDSIANEIAPDGTFRTDVAGVDVAGVIATLNRLRVTGFGSSYQYTCGFGAAARTITQGECQMWGNPIAEMMYEGVRYFAGLGEPTTAFSITAGAGEESQLATGRLPVATWDNPYGNNRRPVCSKPFQTVVSDINPSYDTDQLPGSAFASFTGDLPSLDVSALGQKIWNGEFGVGTTQDIFIGDVANVTDGAPTSKLVSSLGNIRGLSPEEPTKRGGYYAASVAHYGLITDVNPTASGRQNVQTFAVALASPLPKIEIPVGGRKVTLVPFAKSVNGAGISPTATFQPTDQIVDFYVDVLTDTYGRFRVNFEDVEQGADHDMDAIAVYEYTVSGNTVTVRVTSEYAFGGITQHMGYVISGTTRDGIYLEVVDRRDGEPAATIADVDYRLDTPPTFTATPPAPSAGAGRWNDGIALPFVATRTFTPGASAGATVLKDPLWYAAKWGGFKDSNNNRLPDVQGEWDTDPVGSRDAGTPDNYFLVTNALKLSQQLRDAFEEIIARGASASSATVNSGSISSDSRVYQAKFDTRAWTGQLLAYRLTLPRGTVDTNPLWDASRQLPEADARNIITLNSDGITPVPFRYDDLDANRKAELSAIPGIAEAYVNFLRGDASQEGPTTTYRLRERPSKLGDIVSSSPLFVGAPRSSYSDALESAPYSTFAVARRNRAPMVYAGANDGMLHAFDGETGRERFAYIPGKVFANLNRLTQPTYTHRYYVDGPPNAGDVFFGGAWRTVLVGGLNLGGQGIYALNVTDPSNFAGVEGNPASAFLWEFTDLNDRDLGFTYSQPAIVRMKNGVWAAVFGNGYNNTAPDASASTTGNAVLYVVNIATGAVIRKFDTGVGIADANSGDRPNGLATPTMVDVDGDGVIEHAYAGDLFGNMWKFDLRSTNPATWDFAFRTGGVPQPLFTAVDDANNRQPITVRPEVARGPYGAGVMVVFGTGKFLESTDKNINPQRTQTFYGLLDNNLYAASDRITARNLLTTQTITQESVIPDPDGAGPLTALTLRNTSNTAVAGRGWYLNLISPVAGYQGERSVTDPLVRDDRVIFTTLIPSTDPCGFGGSSWLMVLDLLSGGQLTDAQLDSNGDGVVDDRDLPSSGVLRDGTGSRADLGTCLDSNCQSDIARDSGGDGDLNEIAFRSLGGARGRQSWRQIR